MPVNTNSNVYTFVFATIIVVAVALALSSFSVFFKDRIDANRKLDNQFNILVSVDKSITKENAESVFNERIEAQLVKGDGGVQPVSNIEDAFGVDIKKELAKEAADRKVPMYIYSDPSGKKNYIVPLFGAGLWDAIGGYLALEEDLNTISGAVFTHVGETPGLGAEIAKDWFQANFKTKKLFNSTGEFVSIEVPKRKGTAHDDNPHLVDGMSGATITAIGVQDMLDKCLRTYLPFFESKKSSL